MCLVIYEIKQNEKHQYKIKLYQENTAEYRRYRGIQKNIESGIKKGEAYILKKKTKECISLEWRLHIQTSRMLGNIVSCLCRSSLWGSNIFICPDHFVGLFVL